MKRKFVFTGIIVALVIYFIFQSVNTLSTYKVLNEWNSISGLFKDAVNNEIIFELGHCSSRDTMAIFSCDNKQKLIVWNRSDVNPGVITRVVSNEEKVVSDYNFVPFVSIPFGDYLEVRYKLMDNNVSTMSLRSESGQGNTNEDEVIKLIGTEKFALLDQNDDLHSVFDFKNRKEIIEFTVKELNDQAYIIILIGSSDKKNILNKMLR